MHLKPTFISLIALITPVMLLLNSFEFNAFNFDFYEKEFSKNDAYSIGSKEQIGLTAKYLLDYLKHDRSNNPPSIELFEEDETIHMLEVKGLVQKAIFLGRFSLFLFVILVLALLFYDKKKFIENIGDGLLYGGILTIALFLILILLILFNFSSTFALFHKLLFTGNWIFPATSNMIRMFPARFFFDIAVKIFISASSGAAVFIAIGILLKKYVSKSS